MEQYNIEARVSGHDISVIQEAIEYGCRFAHLRQYQAVAVLDLHRIMTVEQRKLYHFTQFYLYHFEAARIHHKGNPIILDGDDVRDAESEADSAVYGDMPDLEPNSPPYRYNSEVAEGLDDFYMDEEVQ